MQKAGHNSSHERRDEMKQRIRNEIKGEIARKGETIASMTKKLGWSANTLGMKLRGERDFTWDQVEEIIDVLGLRDDPDRLHRIFF